MAKTREQKKEILSRLQSALDNTTSAVFVHFTGIPVSDEGEMRGELRKEGVSYFVAKKTLIRRALDGAKLEGETPELEGEVAVAYDAGGEGADPTATPRTVNTFVKKFGTERFSIVGGIYEGTLLDKQAMVGVANIPPVPVLRGMFVNVINSPIQRFAIALGQIAETKAQ